MEAIIIKIPVSGGSINQCWKVQTGEGWYFLKENSSEKFPGMFEAEMKGLQLLRATNTFVVPEPVSCYSEKGKAFLKLEFLERGGNNDWNQAGELLAKLHRNSNEKFGLDHDNYIGSLPQSNAKHDSWEEFFSLERILPQVKRGRDEGRLDKKVSTAAENFCKQIGDIFPVEKPALLHGDLWSGNFFFSTKGPAVFDPAVYFGHREMDLAMTKLFGGFNEDFYAGYENEFPLEKKWKTRIDYCNLYPLLVHVNLFGGGYVGDVKQILSRF
ncbi:MAG TPA: fructosamine kinase family protein [Bacteroidia bacterium]|jgi:fructosamine-3-kinase|nr:fructosamine kinase family protein [Bacteroidia bacterium]